MKTARVAEIKTHLSRYLDAVKAGEAVVITQRGRPVARLVAVDPRRASAARRDVLIRAGVVRPDRGRLRRRSASSALREGFTVLP